MKRNLQILIFTLFFLNLSAGLSFAQGNPEVYKKTVAAIGLITDRTGAVASGFFVNPKTFITNHHV